jgi:Caspase domain
MKSGQSFDGMIRTLMILVAMLLSITPADAKRVALVIANARYASVPALKNPPADAKLVAAALKRAGFDSIDLRPDLGKSALEAALRDFSRQAEGAEVALIYYAGHGIEVGGENYLIPTDAKLERDLDLEVESTRLETALRMGQGARLRIIILDACRNNPFLVSMQRSIRSRAVGRGLAAIEPEGDTLVVYSAKAGATASDGQGTNSPFAAALARRLVEPGLEIGLLFRAIRDDVLTETERTQEPFTYGSLSGTAFYFIPPGVAAKPVAVPSVAAKPTNPPLSGGIDDSLYWQGALRANTAVGYRDYLRQFPQGQYASLARENLTRFKNAGPAPGQMLGPVEGNFPFQFDNGQFPNLYRAFRYDGKPALLAGDFAPTIRRYEFTPNQAQRARLIKSVHDDAADTPAFAEHLREIFPTSDPHKIIRPFLTRHGLSVNNMVDASLVFLEAYRRASLPNYVEPSVTQIAAARRQLTAAIQADPSFREKTQASFQQETDSLLFGAIFLIGLEPELQKRGAEAVAKSRASKVAGSLRSFGMQVEQLKLTDAGYVK